MILHTTAKLRAAEMRSDFYLRPTNYEVTCNISCDNSILCIKVDFGVIITGVRKQVKFPLGNRSVI